MFVARPHASDAKVNIEMNRRNIRLRPKPSLSLPAIGRAVTAPSWYPEIVHALQSTLVCRSLVRVGSAVATMVVSMDIISSATDVPAKMALRERVVGDRASRRGAPDTSPLSSLAKPLAPRHDLSLPRENLSHQNVMHLGVRIGTTVRQND